MTALANCANEDGRSVYPSIPRIMINTGLGRTAVRNNLKTLRAMKLIILVKGAGQHRANEWAINLELLKAMHHEDLDEHGRLRKWVAEQAEEEAVDLAEDDSGDETAPQGVTKRPSETPEVEIQGVTKRPSEVPEGHLESPEGHLVDSRGSLGDPYPSYTRHIHHPSIKSGDESQKIWAEVIEVIAINQRKVPGCVTNAERVARRYLASTSILETDGETFVLVVKDGNLAMVQDRYRMYIQQTLVGMGFHRPGKPPMPPEIIFREPNMSPGSSNATIGAD